VAEEVHGIETVAVERFAWPEVALRRLRRAAELRWWRKPRKRKTSHRRCLGYIGQCNWPHNDVWQVTNELEQELAVEGAPGRRSKLAGVGGRWRPTVGDDFK
jgi:hypothetical protein